jgi:hypothetical protein
MVLIPTITQKADKQRGEMNPLILVVVVLTISVLGLGWFGVWSYMNFTDQRDRVTPKIEAAVAVAKKDQTDADTKIFLEKEKQPMKPFSGPDDFGHVQFSFPKTWSAYLGNNGAEGTGFEAYFQPDVVQSIGIKPSALRISITNTPYDQALPVYYDLIRLGSLKSSPVTVDGAVGVRLDGNFSEQTNGAMIIMKIRDKTLRVYTESKAFLPDFNNNILPTFKFNK